MAETKEYISNITLPNGDTKYVKDSELTDRVVNLENSSESQGDEINTLKESIANVDDKADANANNITALNGKVETNTTDISNLSDKVDTNASNITALNGKVATNTTDISNLSGKIDTNANNITALNGKVETNSEDITTLKNNVDTVTTNFNQYYPQTLTYELQLGSLATYGLLIYTRSSDRFHVNIPTYQGYSSASITYLSGSLTLLSPIDQTTVSEITPNEISDIGIAPSGEMHFKIVTSKKVEENTLYAIGTSDLILRVTLTK